MCVVPETPCPVLLVFTQIVQIGARLADAGLAIVEKAGVTQVHTLQKIVLALRATIEGRVVFRARFTHKVAELCSGCAVQTGRRSRGVDQVGDLSVFAARGWTRAAVTILSAWTSTAVWCTFGFAAVMPRCCPTILTRGHAKCCIGPLRTRRTLSLPSLVLRLSWLALDALGLSRLVLIHTRPARLTAVLRGVEHADVALASF